MTTNDDTSQNCMSGHGNLGVDVTAEGSSLNLTTTTVEPTDEKPRIDTFAAPGCFGGALSFDEKAVECRSCPFKADCAPRATEHLRILRAELGLTDIAARNGQPGSRKPQRSSAVSSSSRGQDTAPAGAGGANPGELSTADWEVATLGLREETKRRADSLDTRVLNDRNDKRLVKLRGRTPEIVGVWLVRQVLKRMTEVEPTAVEVAREYNRRYSASVAARSMRRKIELVDRLEDSGQPWDGCQPNVAEPAPSTHA